MAIEDLCVVIINTCRRIPGGLRCLFPHITVKQVRCWHELLSGGG